MPRKTAAVPARCLTAAAARGTSSKQGAQARPKSKPLSKNVKGKGREQPRASEDVTDAESSNDSSEAPLENVPSEQEDAATTSVPGLFRHISETPEDVEGIREKMDMLAAIDPVEQATQDATFSFNTVDLTAVTFHNPYNSRPIDKLKVRTLRNALLSEGFRVLSNDSRIMVVIDPSLVAPSCITLNPAAPPQPLSLKTGANPTELTIIGGQHRQEAVRLIKSEYTQRMRRLQAAIDSKNGAIAKSIKAKQPPTADEATQRKIILENEIEALKLELLQYKTSMGLVGTWGVVLLDPAKISEVQRISLARNRRTVAYTETDGEKIRMAMKQWPEIVKAGIGRAKSVARVGDSRLATLLEDPDFNRLLKIQNETPKAITWMVSSQWKVAWLWKLLTSPSGGLIAQMGQLMFQSLKLLISSDKLLDQEAKERLSSLLDDFRNNKPIEAGDVTWMMEQNTRAYQKYLNSPANQLQDKVVTDDALMNNLEKISAPFKGTSQCFGFDVPEYKAAFMQYDEGVEALLRDRIKAVQPSLTTRHERDAASDAMDDLMFRTQVAFSTYPTWRFRIPVLTPSTFGAMAETLMQFPHAITEVVSWVYPMAQYILPYGGGASTVPRNITSLLFQEFRNEKTSYWTEQRVSELPTLVTQLLAANIQSLAQLEADLSSPEMVRLCTRPTGDLKKGQMEQLDRKVQTKLGSVCSYKKLAEKMLNTKLARNLETGLKELEGSPWPLTVQSLHHWSSKARKNLQRDLPKLVLRALTEVVVVSEYRPKLLLESTAACFLRTELLKVLDHGLKIPKGGAQIQGQNRIKWTYPDGVQWEPTNLRLPPQTDARGLLFNHARMVDTREGGQEIVKLLGGILRHKAALIKPEDPAYANMVAPEVASCVQSLLNALKENQARQWTIQTTEARTGDLINLEEWDQRLAYPMPNWELSGFKVWDKPEASEAQDDRSITASRAGESLSYSNDNMLEEGDTASYSPYEDHVMEEGHDSGANNDNSASHNDNYEEGEAGSPLTHERTAQRAQRVAPSSVAPPSPQDQGITPPIHSASPDYDYNYNYNHEEDEAEAEDGNEDEGDGKEDDDDDESDSPPAHELTARRAHRQRVSSSSVASSSPQNRGISPPINNLSLNDDDEGEEAGFSSTGKLTAQITQEVQPALLTSHLSRKRSAPSGSSPPKTRTRVQAKGRGSSRPGSSHQFTAEEIEEMAMEDEPF